jgi:hypothetical protein
MITKNDCLTILVKLEDSGIIEARPYVRKLMIAREPSIDVLRFIAQQRGFEIGRFYEMLRKSHNEKKSPLYTNILKEVEEPKEIVVTLSCLLTQILLYGSKLDNPTAFYKEARASEISEVLNTYFETSDLERCLTMLKVIKSDLLVMEYIAGRRDLA